MNKTSRLAKTDWLQAGFRALAEDGPQALRAERLARKIGTTKGSFYWHFSDVPTFHAEMLAYWEQRAFDDVVAHLKHEPDPRARLRKLGHYAAAPVPPEFGGVDVEPAIRAWARADRDVAAATLRIDRQRLSYLHDLLADIGIPPDPLARIIYAALIGLEDLATRDQVDTAPALTQLIELLLGQNQTCPDAPGKVP